MLVYHLILTLVAPFLLLLQGWRRSDWGLSLRESLGFLRAPPQGPTLWLHGASNGEITSARWLLIRLVKDRPGLRVLVTCNTATARRMVAGWGLPQITAAYAPLDALGSTGRLLNRWHPVALISLEAELWPARLATCTKRRIPVAMIGARLSDRSFRRWQRLRPLISTALAVVTLVSAQDPVSRARLLQLGLPPKALAPDFDLKAQAAADGPTLAWADRSSRADWVLAASTHDGEDAGILDAFITARDVGAFTHLIIAPRHPSRAPAITAMIRARGLPFATRSSAGSPGSEPIFLADTMGEMDDWYAVCGACIIGGTFAAKGGHSPWEPARHGCAILHGPSTANFVAPFAALDDAGGAIALDRLADLAAALMTLDAGRQDRLATTAQHVLVATNDPDGLIGQLFRVTGL